MDNNQAQLILVAAACVTALSAGVVACCAVVLTLRMRALGERITALCSRWEDLADEISAVATDFSRRSEEMMSATSDLVAALHREVGRIESTLVLVRTKLSGAADDVQGAVQGAIARVTDLSAALEAVVRIPMGRLRALLAGISGIMRRLSRNRGPTPDRIPADEELFI